MEKNPYYAMQIIRIPVGCVPTEPHNGEYCDGCWPSPSAAEGEELMEDEESPWIELEDNGDCGDGIALSVHRKDYTADRDSGFAGFTIPYRSLGLLIAALSSIQLMRRAEADANARTIR